MLMKITAAFIMLTSTPVHWDTWNVTFGLLLFFFIFPHFTWKLNPELEPASPSSWMFLNQRYSNIIVSKLHCRKKNREKHQMLCIISNCTDHRNNNGKWWQLLRQLSDFGEYLWSLDSWWWKDLHSHYLHIRKDDPDQLDCQGNDFTEFLWATCVMN